MVLLQTIECIVFAPYELSVTTNYSMVLLQTIECIVFAPNGLSITTNYSMVLLQTIHVTLDIYVYLLCYFNSPKQPAR